LIFSTTLSEIFLILRRTERDMIKMYSDIQVKYPLFLLDFNQSWIFSTSFLKILKYLIWQKSVQWEPSCCMRTDSRTDGQTSTTKLKVAFRNLANAPKKTINALANLRIRWKEANLLNRWATANFSRTIPRNQVSDRTYRFRRQANNKSSALRRRRKPCLYADISRI
jgi:hypothetical protein